MKKKDLFIVFFIVYVVIFIVFCAFSNFKSDRLKASVSTASISPSTYGKIHFIKVSSGHVSGDAILLESKGQTCLIDAGNPAKWSTIDYHSQGLDGAKVASYLKNTVGVSKLNCIIATHNHSDHIGGMTQIVSAGLVDSNTKYYYKTYENNNDKYNSDNKSYYDASINAMNSKKAQLVEVTDKNVSFTLGNFNIKLLNNESWAKKGNSGVNPRENNNSIVEYITIGNKTVLLTSDMERNDEERLVNNKSIGKVNILKLGHHGLWTSSSFKFLDATRPDDVIVSGSTTYISYELNAPAIKYLKDKYNKNVYFNSEVNDAIVVDFTSSGYTIKADGTGNISSTAINLTYEKSGVWTKVTQKNGAYAWYILNSDGTPKTLWQQVGGYWYYLNGGNGAMLTGWKKIEGQRYYLNPTKTDDFPQGAAFKGWQQVGNNWHYFSPITTDTFKECASVTGFNTIDGKQYYFNADGVMQTGWEKVGDYYYYFNNSGETLTSWQKINGAWYFFDTGSTPKGKMFTGFRKISNKWYYFKPNGAMLDNECISINGKSYCAASEGPLKNFNGTITVPTAANYCIPATYTGSYQTIVKGAPTGVTFVNTGVTNAVSITVTASLSTGYAWSDSTAGNKTFVCSISPKNLSSSTITVSGQTYTGSALTPLPTVKDGTKTLVKDTDYTVSYSNNVNVGTGTVTVTGKGNYTGTKQATFAINPIKVAIPTAANYCIPATYTGTYQTIVKPSPTGVTFANTGATDAVSITVTANLKTGYTWSDSTTGIKQFSCTISKKDISSSTVTISDQTYTGSALTPLPTVKDGTRTLVKDTDYTVNYSNNINVGTATITITGKGNYTGTKQTTFKINSSVIQIEKPTTAFCKNPTYNGSNQTITINPGTGYIFSGNTGIDAGTYTVTATLKPNYKWSDDSTSPASFICIIDQKSINSLNISIENQIYTGSALTPEPVIKNGSTTLVKGTDYNIVSYENNTNVGTAKINIIGIGNYKDTVSKKFEIISPESSFYFVDSSYMNLENNIINTKLKLGVKSLTKSNFMNNIRSTDTWKLYDKNDNEVTNDSTLVTTGSSIKNNNTEYKIVIFGDIDRDGTLTVRDLYQSYLLFKNKQVSLDEYQRIAADYDMSGSINIIDVYQIYKKMKN